jgi:hypothetical protein
MLINKDFNEYLAQPKANGARQRDSGDHQTQRQALSVQDGFKTRPSTSQFWRFLMPTRQDLYQNAMTATTGSQPVAPPINPWATQPKPATTGTPMVPPLPGDTFGQPNAMATPPTPSYGSAEAPRVTPQYMPVNWNYQDSPEFQQQLQLGLRGANRRLLAMGRSDSTGGINAMNRFEGDLRAQEVKDNWQRAYMGDQANYGRYSGATRTMRVVWRGPRIGTATTNLLILVSDVGGRGGRQSNRGEPGRFAGRNGANQASLALCSGAVSADQIQAHSMRLDIASS